EPLEQFAGDAESESRSTKFARARLVDLTEILPDRLEVAGANADAGVDDVDSHAALRAPRLDRHAPAVRELHRVRQQVEQHLLDLRAVGVNRRAVGRDIDHELELLLTNHRLDLLRDLERDVAKRDRLEMQWHLAGFDL